MGSSPVKRYATLSAIQAALKAGEISVERLVQHYLEQISGHAHLNAFLEVFADEALARAKEIDAKKANGTAGKLAGLVLGIKDNICYKGHKVSAGSKILEGFQSLYSATVVERLLAEDAIILGRLNCDEFAMGSSNEKSAYGPVRNPFDNARVPGGSSGGSVTAVAAGMCHAALGSDTGGSIRQPASFCGVVGMKPTYGRVSRYGLVAYASSFDQIGPITGNVEDAARIFGVIAGKDAHDSTTSSVPVKNGNDFSVTDKKYRIAFIQDCFESKGLNPEIKQRAENILAQLKQQGHTVEAVEFPYLDFMVPAYYVITTAEASSNLSRFGGVVYGHRSREAADIDSTFRKSRTEGFGEEVKRRIMLGTFVLSAGYYDAYYARAQRVRRMLQDKTNEILARYDFIFLPSTPVTAFKIGDISDPVAMYLQDIFTVQANLTGHPAISLPLGQHSNGMPFGLQLMGQKFGEASLFSFAQSLFAQFAVDIRPA